MSIYGDLEQFVQAHRPHGELTRRTTPPTSKGYHIRVACSCGVVFERWVLPQDAEEDIALSWLLARLN